MESWRVSLGDWNRSVSVDSWIGGKSETSPRNGVGRINDHLENLTDYLCERLEGRDYEIVSSRTASEKSHIPCIRQKAI